jgi:hypothetical protein
MFQPAPLSRESVPAIGHASCHWKPGLEADWWLP